MFVLLINFHLLISLGGTSGPGVLSGAGTQVHYSKHARSTLLIWKHDYTICYRKSHAILVVLLSEVFTTKSVCSKCMCRLVMLVLHTCTFVCKFGWVDAVTQGKNTDNSILTWRFTNCVEFKFAIGFPYKNFLLCLRIKMALKTLIRTISAKSQSLSSVLLIELNIIDSIVYYVKWILRTISTIPWLNVDVW